MRVVMIHQYDPLIPNVGGIGTFIHTFIKYAPSDIEIDLVGVSDSDNVPLGKWQTLKAGDKSYRFLPLVDAHPIHRGRIPLNLRLTWALGRSKAIDFRDALIEIHRIEPAMVLGNRKNPKVLFMHAHSMDLYNPKTEVVWKHCPRLYFWIEDRFIGKMDRVFIVREDAVAFYRERHPGKASQISFLPTWSDEDVFVSLPEIDRRREKEDLARIHGLNPAHRWLLFVGRFEGQKDPKLLLESFRCLNGQAADSDLIMIGEGSLEPEIRSFISENNMTKRVHLVGPQSQKGIAQWMNASDLFVLSSAFEGMPRVVVESLQCGLPVVSTDSGEAKRLVSHPAVGQIVQERNPEIFSRAVVRVLNQEPDRRACQEQAAPFTARKILEQVYSVYRELKGK